MLLSYLKALQDPSTLSLKTQRPAQSSKELVMLDNCMAEDQLVVEIFLVLLNMVPGKDRVRVIVRERNMTVFNSIYILLILQFLPAGTSFDCTSHSNWG